MNCQYDNLLKKINSVFLALIFAFATQSVLAGQVLSVRSWPAQDHTRVTIEHNGKIKSSHFTLSNPDRLVVEIAGTTLNATIKELTEKIHSDDPFVKQARVGQTKPNVVRLVFDLKTKITPQVFTLKPIGKYQYRLVLDLYPTKPIADPITALIQNDDTKATLPSKKQKEKTQKKNVTTAKKTSRTQVNRMITIVVDPGHGGEDPGAIGHRGSKEKDVVLSISRYLKTRIEKEPNMRVVMTRNGDYFIPLHKRVDKARQAQADLFISIHADAYIEPRARGSSVFVLSEKGASSTSAKWLAKKENDADLIGGVNIKHHNRQVASVLLDLSTTAQIKDSLKLGSEVLDEIGSINRLHKNYVEQAGFAVLKAPDIPSILIETAFISNPEEEIKLNDHKHQQYIADAIMNGITKYFLKNPPKTRSKMM